VTRVADRLEVALVSDSIYPYYQGGKEIRYHELARRMTRRVDVTVYTMRWWDGPSVRTDGDVGLRAVCGLHELYRGGRRSVRQSLMFGAASLRLLFRRFDLIEVDTVPYPQIFALKLVALLRRRPLVVTWYEVWDADQWRDHLGRLWPVGAVLGRIAMLLPDEVVVLTPATADQLRPRVRRSTGVHLVPVGIDLDAVRAAAPAATSADVLYVGRLIEHKGVGMLLDALALLRSSGTELTALVVGRGPQAAELRAACTALGLDDLVTFRDDVESADEVYGLMKSARVFASPSTREGFGVSVLEALACGVPVVTTNHPENMARLLVEDSGAGQLCDPDAPSVAAALVRALRDPERAGEAWLRGYDWDAIADDLVEVYSR
jgi:glycosyltransferase involved in cell wall biosynthesis